MLLLTSLTNISNPVLSWQLVVKNIVFPLSINGFQFMLWINRYFYSVPTVWLLPSMTQFTNTLSQATFIRKTKTRRLNKKNSPVGMGNIFSSGLAGGTVTCFAWRIAILKCFFFILLPRFFVGALADWCWGICRCRIILTSHGKEWIFDAIIFSLQIRGWKCNAIKYGKWVKISFYNIITPGVNIS